MRFIDNCVAGCLINSMFKLQKVREGIAAKEIGQEYELPIVPVDVLIGDSGPMLCIQVFGNNIVEGLGDGLACFISMVLGLAALQCLSPVGICFYPCEFEFFSLELVLELFHLASVALLLSSCKVGLGCTDLRSL